ncbi:MAG: prepilin-type N-terminal cleavage/methylation domain-containing protein [Desulfosporosinus sp.]|nr:prepilin-type N-terminal cleavage/methylation domain-containing protein [Desulfosporosinus sp.]
MRLNSGAINSEHGFTLLEVLIALLISCIFLMTALRFFTDQWRGAGTLKNHLEAHYAVMTAGKTVTDVIRMAKTVEWANSGILKVLPMPEAGNPSPTLDTYYMGDLDLDGTNDLYWKHLGAPEPLASYITRWECTEVEPGLWQVFLQANVNGQVVTWQSVIRQRVHSAITLISIDQQDMSASLSFCF